MVSERRQASRLILLKELPIAGDKLPAQHHHHAPYTERLNRDMLGSAVVDNQSQIHTNSIFDETLKGNFLLATISVGCTFR